MKTIRTSIASLLRRLADKLAPTESLSSDPIGGGGGPREPL